MPLLLAGPLETAPRETFGNRATGPHRSSEAHRVMGTSFPEGRGERERRTRAYRVLLALIW